MSIASRVLEQVNERPGVSRSDIAQTLKLEVVQVGNALFNLRARKAVRCEFAGRFSQWYPAGGSQSPALASRRVSSVWQLGAAA